MNAVIASTRDKVRRILTDKLGTIRMDNDDRIIVQNNSAVLIIEVGEGFNDGSVVKIECPLIADVEMTPELFKWVSFEGQNFRIGGCILLPGEGGKGLLIFKYSMTGDDLDESELMNAVFAVAYTCDDLDNKLRERFGGSLFGPEN